MKQFDFSIIDRVRKVKWNELHPGLIVLSSVTINGKPMPELANFQVIDIPLLQRLYRKYDISPHHELLVAELKPGVEVSDFSAKIISAKQAVAELNRFRETFKKERKDLLGQCDFDFAEYETLKLVQSPAVEQAGLVVRRYNSFAVDFDGDVLKDVPSFFSNPDLSLSLSQLFGNRLNREFNLPEDKEVQLFLVVDYSKSMDHGGRLDTVIGTLNYFYEHLQSFLKNTQIRLLVFSDECREARYPLTGHEIERRETNYTSFFKKIVSERRKSARNKVIVFTDGEPGDGEAALAQAALARKKMIDYTQIIFNFSRDLRAYAVPKDPSLVVDGIIAADNIFEMRERDAADVKADYDRILAGYTQIATAAGGNQIVLNIDDLLRIIAVECYDEYLGLLTLAERKDWR